MLGLLLGGLWLALLWGRLGALPGLHADALYLPELLRGLLAGHGLSHWDLPPAPSLFPDLPLLWLAGRFGGGVVHAQRVYGLLMGAWLWLALARLLRRCFDLPVRGSRTLAAAGLLLCGALVPAGSSLNAWVLPGHHGAAFVASLALWSWVLRQKAKPVSWTRTLGGAVLAGLLLASDRFFLLWGILPCALLAFPLRRATQVRLAAGAAAALAVAWLALRLLSLDGARVAHLQLAVVWARDRSDWMAVLNAFRAYPSGHAGVGLALAASLGLWLWPRPVTKREPVAVLGCCLLAGVSGLGLAAVLGIPNGRYLYPLLLLPIALLPAWVADRSEAWSRAAVLLPALAGLLWMGAGPVLPAPAPELLQSRALDAELGRRGLFYGWADYFHARPLRLLSGRGTLCAPMISAGATVAPYAWMVERDLFDRGAVVERPQFVVLDGLDPAAVAARLGAPREILRVEGLTLWIYAAATSRAQA